MEMTVCQITNFLVAEFPQINGEFEIVNLSDDGATVSLVVAERHLRPGGTVSGPSMFGLADVAAYFMLANIGPKATAVTTNCNIDFMRKPLKSDLTAKARILKLGKSLIVGDVLLYSKGTPNPVARASLTYSYKSNWGTIVP